jgi:hypothetical protein
MESIYAVVNGEPAVSDKKMKKKAATATKKRTKKKKAGPEETKGTIYSHIDSVDDNRDGGKDSTITVAVTADHASDSDNSTSEGDDDSSKRSGKRKGTSSCCRLQSSPERCWAGGC